jgi:hypothetical protein
MIRRLSSVALALCALGFARQASAQQYYAPPPSVPMQQGGPSQGTATYGHGEAVDRQGFIVGGFLGFAAKSGYGFSLGAEGGYTLPFHLYLGGSVTYFTGSDNVSAYLFEPVVGYDLAVVPTAPVLIRPYAGIGYENVSWSQVCVGNFCGPGTSNGTGVIMLGAKGMYFFKGHAYAGVDIHLDIQTSSWGSAIMNFLGVGGYKF